MKLPKTELGWRLWNEINKVALYTLGENYFCTAQAELLELVVRMEQTVSDLADMDWDSPIIKDKQK